MESKMSSKAQADISAQNSLPIEVLSGMAAPYNPRKKMPTHEFAALRRAIVELGVLDPVCLNRRTQAKGWPKSSSSVIVGGHQRTKAARAEGLESFPVFWVDLTSDEEMLANAALNQIKGRWDDEKLAAMLRELESNGADLSLTGFDDAELKERMRQITKSDRDPDATVGESQIEKRVSDGDVWRLGDHRLACGDSTDPRTVARLVDGSEISMIHADPPYGMGKESDGIANDNLYREDLSDFQMSWFASWRPHLSDRGSAYIWGNPEELWRLWFAGGLSEVPEIHLRNEIVWSKGHGFGMKSGDMQSYSISTERCLFVMLGDQAVGNQNVEDYWEGCEPLREWLCGQLEICGWDRSDVFEITGLGMFNHWFTKSQFSIMTEANYEKLRAAAGGRAFAESYGELLDVKFEGVRDGLDSERRRLYAELQAERTFFDNTHDAMTEVWDFPRVHGEDRMGHATPKPVAMVERAIRSSSKVGDGVGVPFGGTGPEFIACEQSGRRCYAAELSEHYCDTIIARWEAFTGCKAELISNSERGE